MYLAKPFVVTKDSTGQPYGPVMVLLSTHPLSANSGSCRICGSTNDFRLVTQAIDVTDDQFWTSMGLRPGADQYICGCMGHFQDEHLSPSTLGSELS